MAGSHLFAASSHLSVGKDFRVPFHDRGMESEDGEAAARAPLDAMLDTGGATGGTYIAE
jgi:hypothetical protein